MKPTKSTLEAIRKITMRTAFMMMVGSFKIIVSTMTMIMSNCGAMNEKITLDT